MNIHKDGCFCDECEHFPSGKDIIYCYRFVIYGVILLYLFLWKYKLIQGLLYIRINAHELLIIKINTNLCIVWVILRGKLESFEDSVRSRVVICRMTVIDTTQTVTCVVYIKAVCDVTARAHSAAFTAPAHSALGSKRCSLQPTAEICLLLLLLHTSFRMKCRWDWTTHDSRWTERK